MYRRSSLLGLAVILSMVLVAPFALVQPARAQFVIAASPVYDEYGQGLESFELFENSTGSWVQVGSGQEFGDTFEWEAGVAIKLIVYSWFNSTLTGASDSAEGKLYQRHNVTVTNRAGVEIFTQANFTYVACDTGIDPPLWFYSYSVVLNFLPAYLVSYLVTVTYEVFY